MSPRRTTLFLSLSLAMGTALAADPAAIDAELLALRKQIAAWETPHAATEGSDNAELVALAEARKEVMLLSEALLENQRLAATGGATQTLVVPVQPVDTARATQLLAEMAGTQARLTEAETALTAAPTDDPATATALRLRVATEQVTLTRLQLAYLQAQYGLAWTSLQLPPPPSAPPVAAEAAAETAQGEAQGTAQGAVAAPPAWADAGYPDIDYRTPWFTVAHEEGDTLAGWWTIQRDPATAETPERVIATNHSLQTPSTTQPGSLLAARCETGETGLLLLPDVLREPLPAGPVLLTYRLDDGPEVTTQWRGLGTGLGAGVFGPGAIAFLRHLYRADTLHTQLTDTGGAQGAEKFDLRGVIPAVAAVADACDWEPLPLSSADYRQIQTRLKVAGHATGAVDGRWGPASRRALQRFQEGASLPATGNPDLASLRALGYEPPVTSSAR